MLEPSINPANLSSKHSACSLFSANNHVRCSSAVAVQVFKEAERLGLVHPRDRNGALMTDRFSTPELEAALEAYRAACAAAADRVRDQLRSLASRLTVRRQKI